LRAGRGNPPESVIRAIREEAEKVNYYPDDAIYYLTRKLAGKLGVSPDMITWGAGTVEIIRMFSLAFVQPGDVAIVGIPSFSIYDYEFRLAGAELLRVPLRSDYHYDVQEMIRLAKERKPKVLVICSPNNPTGVAEKEEVVREVLKASEGEYFVILDEAYAELVTDPDYHNGVKLLREFPNLIVMRTLSKAYALAGLRIGYAISHPLIAKMLNNVRLPFNLSRISQAAALAALDEEEYVLNYRLKIDSERRRVSEALSKLGVFFIPSQTNFIAIKVEDDFKVAEELRRKGVIVRPGSQFNMPGFIRVTLSPEPEVNDRFLKDLREILNI